MFLRVRISCLLSKKIKRDVKFSLFNLAIVGYKRDISLSFYSSKVERNTVNILIDVQFILRAIYLHIEKKMC
jgi:hypothetical protein